MIGQGICFGNDECRLLGIRKNKCFCFAPFQRNVLMVFCADGVAIWCLDFLHSINRLIQISNHNRSCLIGYIFAYGFILCFHYFEFCTCKWFVCFCIQFHKLQGRSESVIKFNLNAFAAFQIYILALVRNKIALRCGNLRNGIPTFGKIFDFYLTAFIRHAFIYDTAAFFHNGKLCIGQWHTRIFIIFFNENTGLCLIFQCDRCCFACFQLHCLHRIIEQIACRCGNFFDRIGTAFQIGKACLAGGICV